LFLCAAAFAQTTPKAVVGSITAFKAEDALVFRPRDSVLQKNRLMTRTARLVLLIGAGLLLRSFWHLLQVRPIRRRTRIE